MRITDGMLINNMSYNLNESLNRLQMLQFQTSTGKKFRLPSDDPIGASKSLKLRTDLAKSQQYRRNVDDASSWMRETESALDNINDILHRANQLTVQAANGIHEEEDLLKIREEIKELKESLIQIGNSTYGERSIFTGYQTDKKLLNEDGTYAIDLKQLYKRDSDGVILKKDGTKLTVDGWEIKTDEKVEQLLEQNKIDEDQLAKADQIIEYNTGVSETVKVNTIGNKVFGKATKGEDGYLEADYKSEVKEGDKPYLIALFEKLENALEGVKIDDETEKPVDDDESVKKLQECIEDIQGARGNILSVTSEIGARGNRLKITGEKLKDQELNFEDLLSDVEDVSLPEAYMQMMLEMNVYNASLSVGAQVIQPSLVDFIR